MGETSAVQERDEAALLAEPIFSIDDVFSVLDAELGGFRTPREDEERRQRIGLGFVAIPERRRRDVQMKVEVLREIIRRGDLPSNSTPLIEAATPTGGGE